MNHAASKGPLVRPFLDRIADWLEAHAGLAGDTPATPADLASLAETLGVELPDALVEVLGFERQWAILEYARIPPNEWARELARTAVESQGDPSFAAQRWLPLAEDGGGNLWIVDLSSSPAVIRRWERHGRVVSRDGRSIPAFFAHLALALESGRLKYDSTSGTYDGPFIDLLAAPLITSDAVIVFRTSDLAQTDLGVIASERLPDDAGPHGCLYFITATKTSRRMFAAIPERDVDHADEGMLLAADVISRLQTRCDLSAFGESSSFGFHGSPAEGVERWLRSQEDLFVMPLATLLVALEDGPSAPVERSQPATVAERDFDIGHHHFDALVRGDALMGIIPDVPAFTKQMLGALWRAAEAGDARAFATLGECYFAVLVPCGAFDGVNPENDEARRFSQSALSIEDDELPPLTFALRCWYEAAARGDRAALLRFANISRTGPEHAKRLALDLLTDLSDPSPKEVFARGLVHAWLGEHSQSVAAHTAAAERGDLDAAFELHVAYAQGTGVEADPVASRAWLERAAAGDHPRALYNVAAEYATGNGREKDPPKAAQLYETAAELGNPRAAASLAYMILSGECPGSVDDACNWLDVAEQGGFDTAAMLEGVGLDDPRA